jgi:hypothetical protein
MAFRLTVTVNHRPFGALLVIEDEVEGQPRAGGPTRIRWLAAIADHVSRILSVHVAVLLLRREEIREISSA